MQITKQCKGCLKALPINLFYRHKGMLDGHLNFCRECVTERVSKHRKQNLERFQAYDRERAKLPHRLQQFRELVRRHNADPVTLQAHRVTTYAIRCGKLIRPDTCSECGKKSKPEAHHDDYSKPLEVRWLCRSCHCRFHRLQFLASQLHLPDA